MSESDIIFVRFISSVFLKWHEVDHYDHLSILFLSLFQLYYILYSSIIIF